MTHIKLTGLNSGLKMLVPLYGTFFREDKDGGTKIIFGRVETWSKESIDEIEKLMLPEDLIEIDNLVRLHPALRGK
jgi:hypothetical protein